MNATQVFVETPGVAAANAPVSGTGSKPGKPNVADFKKQLASCDEDAMVNAHTMPCSSNTDDHSMANGSEVKGIAGILEGFGLLDYQADTPPVWAENAEAQPDIPAAASVLPEEGTSTAAEPKQTGVAEQFARMLSDKPHDMLPPDVQQQIRSGMNEYQGSLESTNNDRAAAVMPLEEETVPKDKLPAFLLNLKATQQEAKPVVTPEWETAARFANAAEHAEVQPLPKENAAKPLPADTMPKEAKLPETQQPVQAAVAETQTAVQTAPAGELAEAKRPADVDFVRDNVIRIVDKVSTQAAEGKYECDVTLKPEFLGKVSIRLTMENGSFRMQIRTEDMGVKGLFTDQLSGLQSLLKDKGIAVASIDVMCQSGMSGGFEAYRQNRSHNGAENGGKQKNSRFSGDEIVAAGLYDVLAGDAGHYIGGSTVEYLA